MICVSMAPLYQGHFDSLPAVSNCMYVGSHFIVARSVAVYGCKEMIRDAME